MFNRIRLFIQILKYCGTTVVVIIICSYFSTIPSINLMLDHRKYNNIYVYTIPSYKVKYPLPDLNNY